MTEVNQLFRVVSIWRDFNQNQLIETHNQLFETYQLKNLIDLYRLRLNQISKQNSEHKKAGGVSGFWGTAYMGATYFLKCSLPPICLRRFS